MYVCKMVSEMRVRESGSGGATKKNGCLLALLCFAGPHTDMNMHICAPSLPGSNVGESKSKSKNVDVWMWMWLLGINTKKCMWVTNWVILRLRVHLPGLVLGSGTEHMGVGYGYWGIGHWALGHLGMGGGERYEWGMSSGAKVYIRKMGNLNFFLPLELSYMYIRNEMRGGAGERGDCLISNYVL